MQLIRKSPAPLSTPVSGMALVAEGGGQRGAFTAGVLDSWQIANFNPFEILIGTSAGAQNIASYLSKQTGYAYTLISNLTNQQQFFSPWRLLKGKNAMDLDWYFKQANSKFYQFDNKQASENSIGRKVRFSASDSLDLATQLIDPNLSGWLQALKYSSAIPYLYKSNSLVDGGVTAPLPVKEAHELGADTILTIRTQVDSQHIIPKPIKHMKSLICKEERCPNFLKLWQRHESAYQQAEAFIQQPPKQVKIIEIKPERPLATRVLGSSHQSIVADYKYGFAMGKQFLENQNNNSVIH